MFTTGDDFLHAIRSIDRALNESTTGVDISSFLDLCERKNELWARGVQQDAIEAIEFILNETNALRSCFLFQASYRYSCDSECPRAGTESSEEDVTLRLSSGDPSSRLNLLDLMSIHAYKQSSCPNCKAECKSWELNPTRNTLMVQLPRYTLSIAKNRAMIAFPKHIGQPQLQDRYKLVSVISHYGTEHGGHYRTFNHRASEWLEYDDIIVRRVDFEKTVHDKHAYILFYHRPNFPGTPPKSPRLRGANAWSPKLPLPFNLTSSRWKTLSKPDPSWLESLGISEHQSVSEEDTGFDDATSFVRDMKDNDGDSISEHQSISEEGSGFGDAKSFMKDTEDNDDDVANTFNAGGELSTSVMALEQITISYAEYDLRTFQGLEQLKRMLEAKYGKPEEIEDFIEHLQGQLEQSTDGAFVKIKQVMSEEKAEALEAMFIRVGDSV